MSFVFAGLRVNLACIVYFLLVESVAWAAPISSDYARLYSVEALKFHRGDGFSEADIDVSELFKAARFLVERASGTKDGPAPSHRLSEQAPYTVHLSLRLKRRFFSEGIGLGGENLYANLASAISHAIRLRQEIANDKQEPVYPKEWLDKLGIEISILHSPKVIEFDTQGLWVDKIDRGIDGLIMQSADRISAFSPNKPLIHNYSTKKLIRRLTDSIGSTGDFSSDNSLKLFRTAAVNFVQQSPNQPPLQLVRGDQLIHWENVNEPGLKEFNQKMVSWLTAMLRENGRMEYKYMPSRGEYSKSNNMIRQWMATLAVADSANLGNDKRLHELWHQNVQYNLASYYFQANMFGTIKYNNKIKLGAIAIAALALQAGHKDSVDQAAYISLIDALWSMRQSDGSFKTFLLPENRNDNQNFYPGEALLALARSPGIEEDIARLKLIKESIDFYMHFYNSTGRNTAFIPWHTMANWELFRITGDNEYAENIFKLNDWLINIQDINKHSSQDIRGRFFVDAYSQYGPPHASSTGVYVEGLAYAYDLAVKRQDNARAQAYLTAIKWGLRSLMQLQYRYDNSFYLNKRSRALGGLRTRINDNQLRIDNTQHAIMAVNAVLRFVPSKNLEQAGNDNSEYRSAVMKRFEAHDSKRQ